MEHAGGPPEVPGGQAPSGTFSRRNRLARTWEYQRVYDRGRSRRGAHVVLYALLAPGEPSRVGIVASRKVGGAVERNRVKRRLRQVVRALWPRVPAADRQLVLIALSHAATVDFESLEADVADLLVQLGVIQP